MDKQSIYMMLTAYKKRPFSFVINYQGTDVILDFWAERMTLVNSQYTIIGTMFMKSGAELLGKVVTDVSTEQGFIKIKGDRHTYYFTPIQESQEYWNDLIDKLKNFLP